VALAVVFVDCGLRSWVYLQNFHIDAGPCSTRAQAAEWIDAHIPVGATVGLARYPQPAHTPPFRYDRYRLVIFERPEFLTPRQRPDYVVFDEQSRGDMPALIRSGYELAQSFASYQLAWARAEEGAFPNEGFYILYRRPDAL
jgi:hypothetical protein